MELGGGNKKNPIFPLLEAFTHFQKKQWQLQIVVFEDLEKNRNHYKV